MTSSLYLPASAADLAYRRSTCFCILSQREGLMVSKCPALRTEALCGWPCVGRGLNASVVTRSLIASRGGACKCTGELENYCFIIGGGFVTSI